jgi:peptide-N4-(N-acetyl-beta-glucosaminyl)asparagine amidase
MIGKTKETADPTIMFCGQDAGCRKHVRKTVKESGILDKHPGVRLGDASLPLGFDQLVQLAGLSYRPAPKVNHRKEHLGGSTSISNEPELGLDLYSNQLAFADPSGCLSGKKLLIPFHDSNRNLISVRMATGGGILHAAERHFYLTASHVFQDGENSSSPDQSKEERGFQFDISDEEDSSDESDLEDTTSRGSRTPDIDESTTSDDMTTSSSTLAHSSDQVQGTEERSSLSGEQHSISTMLEDLFLGSVVVGRRVESSENSATGGLDYCLVETSTAFREFTESPLHCSSGPPYSLSGRLLMRQHDKEVLSVTASAGLIRGTMSGTPTYQTTPSSRRITHLWTVKFEATLSDGDCGSWVVDEGSGDLVGHIVSGSPKSGSAYILPACHVFADAAASFGLELEVVTFPSTDVTSKPKGQSVLSTRNPFNPSCPATSKNITGRGKC